MPPGRSASAPARRIAPCRRASSRGRARRLAPAGVGPRGERAEVRARRVDQHAVVGLALLRLGGVGRAHLHALRPHAGGRARERLRAAGVALDRHHGAPALHQRGEMRGLAARGGAQVEHALARGRGEDPPDRHRRARLRHERALLPQRRAERVEGALEHEPLRQVPGRVAWPPAARRRAPRRSCAARSRAARPPPGGCRPPSARGRRRRRAPRTSSSASQGG